MDRELLEMTVNHVPSNRSDDYYRGIIDGLRYCGELLSFIEPLKQESVSNSVLTEAAAKELSGLMEYEDLLIVTTFIVSTCLAIEKKLLSS